MTAHALHIAFCLLLFGSSECWAQGESDSVSVDSIAQTLPDVLVEGERPIAVVHGSAITYDLPRLIEKKGVSNIYDAIKELPGVTG